MVLYGQQSPRLVDRFERARPSNVGKRSTLKHTDTHRRTHTKAHTYEREWPGSTRSVYYSLCSAPSAEHVVPGSVLLARASQGLSQHTLTCYLTLLFLFENFLDPLSKVLRLFNPALTTTVTLWGFPFAGHPHFADGDVSPQTSLGNLVQKGEFCNATEKAQDRGVTLRLGLSPRFILLAKPFQSLSTSLARTFWVVKEEASPASFPGVILT